MNAINISLIAALPESETIHELEKHLKDDTSDLLIFPECYLNSDLLDDAQSLIMKHKKWVVTGLDDYRQYPEKSYLTSLVISRTGEIVGEHKKTMLTRGDKDEGYSAGDSIEAIDTPFGKIGLVVCYEIHFQEICRSYAEQGVKFIFNMVGFGMYDEGQFKKWNNLARDCAVEYGCYVMGCSHFSGNIPIVFAYEPGGRMLLAKKAKNQSYKIRITTI